MMPFLRLHTDFHLNSHLSEERSTGIKEVISHDSFLGAYCGTVSSSICFIAVLTSSWKGKGQSKQHHPLHDSMTMTLA